MKADRKPFSIQPYVAPALAVLAVIALVPLSGILPPAAAEEAQVVPAPTHDEALASAPGSETAVVAGGCFWGIPGVFQHMKGVTKAVSGYSGGDADTAHYQVVGTGTTGHAESVQSPTTRARSATASSCRSSSPSRSIRHRRTARVPTSARSIVQRSSSPTRRRLKSPKTTSRSSTRPACSAGRSPPRFHLSKPSTRPRTITRTTRRCILRASTSCTTTFRRSRT